MRFARLNILDPDGFNLSSFFVPFRQSRDSLDTKRVSRVSPETVSKSSELTLS